MAAYSYGGLVVQEQQIECINTHLFLFLGLHVALALSQNQGREDALVQLGLVLKHSR